MYSSSRSVVALICLFLIGVSFFPIYWSDAGEPKAQDAEILALGVGAIVSGNLALAKESAVTNALNKGVEVYLLGRLGSETSAANFQRVVQEILPGAREMIENYRILAEDRSPGQVRVLVGLKVNHGVVEARLRESGILATLESGPKVLFLVSERRRGVLSYWWKDPEHSSAMTATDLALHKVFEERGFVIVQRSIGSAAQESPESARSPDLLPQDAIHWGRVYGADLVVGGITEVPLEGDVTVRLMAADVREEKVICREERAFPGRPLSGGDDALVQGMKDSISEMASALTPCMLEAMKAGEPTLTQLNLRLEGLRSLKEAVAFRGFLSKDVSGVRSVKQTRIKKDSVSFLVEFKGSQERFLNQLLNHENPPFPLEPGDIGAGEIVLMVQ